MSGHYNTLLKILTPINRKKFQRIVHKYKGDYASKKLNSWEHFVSLVLGQFMEEPSLRNIEAILNLHKTTHYHLGLRQATPRSTLSDANNRRDWRIFRDLFYELLHNLRTIEQHQTQNLIQLLDATPIMLNTNLHKWADRNHYISGMKLHVVYNLEEKLPTYFEFSGMNTNDIEVAKTLEIQNNATYVMDRGYMDYNWWYEIDNHNSIFVTRLKRNNAIIVVKEQEVVGENIISDDVIKFNKRSYRNKPLKYTKNLRRIIVHRENKNPLVLVTNDFSRTAKEIATLYKQRWEIELFFKWIKGHLKIKKLIGRSENAIKTQICVALIVFVLVRIALLMKKVINHALIKQKISLKTLIVIIKNSLFVKNLDFNTKKIPKISYNSSQLNLFIA